MMKATRKERIKDWMDYHWEALAWTAWGTISTVVSVGTIVLIYVFCR